MDKRIDAFMVLLMFCVSTFFSYIGEEWLSGLGAGIALMFFWTLMFTDL